MPGTTHPEASAVFRPTQIPIAEGGTAAAEPVKGSTAAPAAQGKPVRPPRPAQADAAPRQPPPREATVIIVGSGPAGLGTAALFEQCGIDVVVLERGEIAQTFRSWPKETRFISPSFTGNFFGAPDLNAVTPDSSPAFALQTQHPTGHDYSKYLISLVNHLKIDVATKTEVLEVLAVKKVVSADENDPKGCGHDDGGLTITEESKEVTEESKEAKQESATSEKVESTVAAAANAEKRGASDDAEDGGPFGFGDEAGDEGDNDDGRAQAHAPAGHSTAAVAATSLAAGTKSKKWQWDKDSKRKTATAAVSNADVVADMAASKSQLPDITVRTLTGDYTGKFVIWAGGEFQYPNSIPNTIRVGHGSKYAAYADLPRGDHVVIGGSESGIDIAHFLIGLGDTVTVLDDTAPWNSRESDSSL
eukprot:gene3217-23761_t